MPTMIKMASIMKAKKTEWSQQQELPVFQSSFANLWLLLYLFSIES